MTAVADYAPELGSLADALGVERFSVLGYSGGGPYALAVASVLVAAVRIAEIVAGAGEIGTFASMKELSRSDQQLTWLALHAPLGARFVLRVGDFGARLVPRIALRSSATEMGEPDRRVLYELGPPREALALFTQAMTRTTRGVVADYALLAYPWRVPLGGITVPVHCWHGTADTLVPVAHTTALLERLPGAALTTWPGEGHLALITHVAEVLDDIVAAPA